MPDTDNSLERLSGGLLFYLDYSQVDEEKNLLFYLQYSRPNWSPKGSEYYFPYSSPNWSPNVDEKNIKLRTHIILAPYKMLLNITKKR